MPETGNLKGTVVDDKNAPLPGATVTLIGAAAPQTQATDAQGQFSFTDLPPGTYKLSAVSEELVPALRSDVVITAGQSTETRITMKAKEDAVTLPREAEAVASVPATSLAPAPLLRKPAVQSMALSGIGLLFAFLLYKGLGFSAIDLGNDEVARGVITYLVSVGTIMIAIVLVFSVILGNEEGMKDRFALGKEVLTILIGVLGTIIGFYYGSTIKEVKAQPSAMQMTPIVFSTEQPTAGTTVKLSTTITGGVPHYTYSIKADKEGVIASVVNQKSEDGKINHDIAILPTAPAVDVNFVIEAKDSKEAAVTSDQKKITVKAPPSAP